MVDWKTQYAKHAAGALSVAAAGGFLLGALSAPDRPRSSDARRVRRDHRDAPPTPTTGFRPGPRQRAAVAFVDTRDQVVEALLNLASVKVIEVIGRFVPGFGDELSRTQGVGSTRGLEGRRT